MDEEERRRIAELAKALRPTVARIEDNDPTVADYVCQMDRLADMLDGTLPAKMDLAISMALLRAGANPRLVNEALRHRGRLSRAG